MEKLPKILEEVVKNISDLPGLGPKSSLKIALTFLKWPKEKVQKLVNSIIQLKESLFLCDMCGNISDENPCSICKDPTRDDTQLCVVPDFDSFLVIEESGLFKGKFFVLSGLISAAEGTDVKDINIDRLKKRIRDGNVKEVILALGTTKESEITESYITNIIKKEFPDIVVTRLAQGIPLGITLKYVDPETLRQSFNFRQRL